MSLQEAQSPTTTPERLRQLFNDQTLRAALAENPNTPDDLLFLLIQEHTDALFRNPVLPVLLLENPSFFLELPTKILQSLLSSPAPHPWLLALLRSPEGVSNKHGASLLYSLADQSKSIEVLALLAASSNEQVRFLIALNLLTPQSTLDALLLDTEAKVREQATKNPSLSVEVLTRLSMSKDVTIKSWVAANPSTPVTILDLYLNSSNKKISGAANRTLGRLARMKATPVDTLLWLYHSGHEAFSGSAYLTLLEIAALPTTTSEILTRLAAESDSRLQIAASRATSL